MAADSLFNLLERQSPRLEELILERTRGYSLDLDYRSKKAVAEVARPSSNDGQIAQYQQASKILSWPFAT